MTACNFCNKGPGGAGLVPGVGAGGGIPGRVPYVPGYGSKHATWFFEHGFVRTM